jgi:hypothetical protein
MANTLDLGSLFGTVTEQLTQKKESLNEADTYNHDHGDHMVQIFSLIQDAVAQKSDQPVADQLDFASQMVKNEAQSGSGQLYAQGLSSAANNLAGSSGLDQDSIMTLVKSLLNADQPQQEPEPQQKGGLLGSLLSGLMGKSESQDAQKGFDMNDLLRAGMAFYQSQQDGDSTMDSLINALMAASPLGQSPHRAQSGSIVASTIMNFAKSFLN